ncbi:MAG: YedE family putative selenium transporter [Peptococcia bacterium]
MKERFFDSKRGIVFTGAVIGILAVILMQLEDLLQTEFCIACFMDDLAGVLGLYKVTAAQYFQLEIIGVVLGAFLMAFYRREFSTREGSSPLIRFVLGFLVMVGILMFLGCPLRMTLRLGEGDLNALWGLAGLVTGIVIGIFFLKRGFGLKRNYCLPKFKGPLYFLVMISLLILFLLRPLIFYFSKLGFDFIQPVIWFSFLVGIVIGILAQRTRLCLVGGFRNLFLCKDTYLFLGFLSILVFTTFANINAGTYKLGFRGQPLAHTASLWNFLAMVLIGWSSLFLGGCPLRQLVLLGEGKIDALVTFLGMLAGAVFAHYFKVASSVIGPTFSGKIAVTISLVILFFIAYSNTEDLKLKRKGKESKFDYLR